jgi:hypothetical protein
MRRWARLIDPVIGESMTFWKATHGNPTGFTLKKRYFVAVLEEAYFVDTKSDRIHCCIPRGVEHRSAR